MLGELIFGFAWLVMPVPFAAKVLVGHNDLTKNWKWTKQIFEQIETTF